MEFLDKVVNGVQFKGESNRYFCERVVDYFLPRFRNSLVFEPKTDKLFDAEIKYFNNDNLNDFINHTENNKINGQYSIQTIDKSRKFKTILYPEMIDYIKSLLIK